MLTDYHAKYISFELTKRCPVNSIEKFVPTIINAQVDLNPHQVEAALFAFRSPFSKGVILADEVGLGKTIEAGIIISQKWAEKKRKLLIIVPSSLRKQWEQELLEKFFLPSVILETKSFNAILKDGNANPYNCFEIVICSYHFARNKADFIKLIEWDLVILDEAHRLRNVYKASNVIASDLKSALEKAPKLLLTATPLQNSLLELYGLVSMIDDYIFGDIKTYKAQYIFQSNEVNYQELKLRLNPICKRTLRRQVTEYINYTNRIPLTQDFTPTKEEQFLYDKISEYLRHEKLYALPVSQRHLITLILRKLLSSSTFAIAGTLRTLVERLETLQSKNIKQNLIPSIYDDYEGIDEEEINENIDEKDDVIDTKKLQDEIDELKSYFDLAKSITNNTKGEALLSALKIAFKKIKELGAFEKAIIFTESRRTQDYLFKLLSNSEYGGQIVLFNGSNSDPLSKNIYERWKKKYENTDQISGSKSADLRAALVENFKNESKIMLATESAAEGINLQFCSLVVNYDLPWNPQRIEQRIGRCHRYGQKHDVVVVNFLNRDNAADRRVFQLLSEKFQLFSGVFGASDEILGAIESGINFEKRIADIYQKCRTEEEIKLYFDNLQKELDEQIQLSMTDTRQKLLENFDEEVHEKLKINLINSKECLTKYENWLWNITQHHLLHYADFKENKFEFFLNKNPFKEPISLGSYKMGNNINDAHIYRINHPLAENILSYYKNLDLNNDFLEFDYSKSNKKITIIENLIGLSGYLSLILFSIETPSQSEDYLLFAGITEKSGKVLEEEQCKRLFSLPAKVVDYNQDVPKNIFLNLLEEKENKIISKLSERDAHFFEEQMDKLEKWSEDVKKGLEIKLKELDIEIKSKKTESRKILNLKEKISAQQEIKDLEKKRNKLRMNFFEALDDVDKNKEKLLDYAEQSLKQTIKRQDIFKIKWKLV